MKCAWHLCENILDGKKRKYCSIKCKNKFGVDKRRKKLKQMAVEYKGGCCKLCGYSKYVGALEFHHLSPEEKDFSISSTGTTKSWDRIRKELDKCIMVCSNCHREVHGGLTIISEKKG